jgi:hypothetical protein
VTRPAELLPYNSLRSILSGVEDNLATNNWYWEDVSTLSGAEKAITGGFWAAVIVAGITSLVAALSLAGVNLFGIDAKAFLDAALFAGIAFGIWRKSRFAAVAGLCLYVLERIYMMQRTGVSGIFMGIIFTLLFINAVRGAFAYHRLNESGPARPLQMNP